MGTTRENVIRLAIEAGATMKADTILVNGKDADDLVTRLVDLAKAEEREACAKLVEPQRGVTYSTEVHGWLESAASEIRSRGLG